MRSTHLSVRRLAWTHCYGLLRQSHKGASRASDSVRISSRAQHCNLLSLHAATYEPGMSRLAAGSQAHPRREITPAQEPLTDSRTDCVTCSAVCKKKGRTGMEGLGRVAWGLPRGVLACPRPPPGDCRLDSRCGSLNVLADLFRFFLSKWKREKDPTVKIERHRVPWSKLSNAPI